MAPKLTARQRAVELHAAGRSKEDIRLQMVTVEGYTPSSVSQVSTPWPPRLSSRAANFVRKIPSPEKKSATEALSSIFLMMLCKLELCYMCVIAVRYKPCLFFFCHHLMCEHTDRFNRNHNF